MLEEGGGEDDDYDETDEQEPDASPEISLEDREAQDFGWDDQ